MTVLRHNFDGGPNGTTITVANSSQVAGNDAFQAVGSGARLFLQYGSLVANGYINPRPTAEFIMGIAVQNSGARPYVAWLTAMGNQTEIWTRFYFYITTATPTANDLNIFSVANGAGVGPSVWLDVPANTLQIRDSATTPAIVSMSTALVPNVWHRVEFHAIMGATTGSSDLYLYADPDADADSAAYTETISQSGATYGAPPATQYILGQGQGTQVDLADTFFSNWELNNTDYPGPAPFRLGKGYPAGNMTNPVAIHVN